MRGIILAVTGVVLMAGCPSNEEPKTNQPPAVGISSPTTGTTFQGGSNLSFAASAIDPEDGILGANRVTWWAELHHDTHTHPFVPETAGNTGTAIVPTQGETSANIFYRFHFRAVDSAGNMAATSRDVLPQIAQISLSTVPAGLQLTLDGQPVTANHLFTGVVGIQRTLGAPDQNFNNRRYQFASWNDMGARNHTISTPAVNSTYTATYLDLGPASNEPPTVSLTAPATGPVGVAMTLNATAADSDGTVTKVDFFDNSTLVGTDQTSPYTLSWTPATQGARNLTAVATDNDNATTTSNVVPVTITPPGGDTQVPTVTLTQPAQFADGLTGTLTLTATATDNVGVTGVEFQVDGVAVGPEDTSAPYQATVNTALFASGQHVVRARARDASGNLSTWASATVRFSGSVAVNQGFTRNTSWITGLSSATAFAQTPDGRILVAQQGGALRVVKNGVLLATSFMTLSVDPNGERGLLGVAVSSTFASDNLIYVYYTTTSGGTHNRISRFTANGDVMLAGSEVILVDLPGLSSATNHNGGALHFGADGKLYVAVGDNANAAKAQILTDPFGKILRFNADGSIPNDNPFCSTAGNLACAVWAYGLRNPFTFAVQPTTGKIFVNDVGQGTWEEINVGAAGANFGWPQTEGPTSASGVTAPIFAYRHSATSPPGSGPGGFFTGFAIAGGAFYPQSGNFPAAYRGNYFFADYVSNYVGRLDLANGNVAYAFASLSGNPVDLLVGTDGALYALTRSAIVRFTSP
ncbi:MAG: PQQ-dependent sugar dehydrogenase [Burkholderiales bacterium]